MEEREKEEGGGGEREKGELPWTKGHNTTI